MSNEKIECLEHRLDTFQSLIDKMQQFMHACKSSFLGPGWNWSTRLFMHAFSQLLGRKVHSWLGAGLTTYEDCAISGQSSWLLPRFAQILCWASLLGKFAQILMGVLAGRIAQSWSPMGSQRGLRTFWREGWLPSINAQFSRGSYSAYRWTKSRWTSWEGNGSTMIDRLPLCEKNTEAWVWQSKTKCCERLLGRLQNRLRKNFGGWL